MKKNVAGQKIGAQMVSASDGSAFTGSVTVSVTGDAGTQATGSVGSGACAHEGNGYHTYAPAQAETNYDLIAFTFTGTGAVPATVQVYPSFPQTIDNLSAAQVNAEADTALADAALATAANLATVAGYLDTEILAIKAKTDNLPASPAAVADIAAALEATIADSIPADGTRPSIKQALYMMTQFMVDRGIVGTTMTIRKPDGATALFTLTLNDAADPTSYTRAT